MSVEKDVRGALASYISELEKDFAPWYERASSRLAKAWGIFQMTVILTGILTSVLAALADESSFKGYTVLRISLVVLPILGTLAASLLSQVRMRELLALREQGREAMQTIVAESKAEFAAAHGDDQKLSTLHRRLIAQVSELEKQQAANFFTIAPGESTGSKGNVAATQQHATT